MIGAGARGFEPRDVGEIDEFRRRLERVDEIAEIVAIGVQDFRARRMRHDEDPRHRAEEFLADDPLDVAGNFVRSALIRPATTLLR